MDGSKQDLLSNSCADSAILGRVALRRGYCLSSASPARARDRARSRRPARPGRTAATVLVLGLMLLGAAAAEAQTTRIFVSNSGQTADDSANTSGNDHAQLFQTGANTAGYTFISMFVNSEDAQGDDFDVEICEADTTANEFPTSTCTALTAPDSFTAGNLLFTHTGLALSANTNYVVVVKQRGTGSVELNTTTSGGEDTSLGLSDWSIKDKFYWKSGSTWMLKSGSDEALRIIVRGYANTVADATDATLSALSVSGATLSPAFDAAQAIYKAVVANAVTQSTITATTSESTATIEYLDESDNTLTDADTMTAGLQVNLSVGSTIVKVKVTAPDTTTTETYSVFIVRVAVPVACSAASMTNRIWTGNLTVGRSSGTPLGYRVDYGSLDNTMFSLRGNAHSIDVLNVTAGSILNFSLDALETGLGEAANDLVLHVGNQTFALADATFFSTNGDYVWYTNVPTWADGDAVCLALTVDGPAVSSVALTSNPGADNTYAIGESVAATVTFDAAVDITGSPQLELDFDGTAKAATCATATNTTTMACSYTVLAGEEAPNGVAIAANKLTGGTIYATGSTTISADLDHTAVAIDASHKVDGIRPTLVTTSPDAPTTSTDGETVVLVFSEAIGAVDRTKITIGIGGGNFASTSAARVAETKVELDLSTVIDATVTLTVQLDGDAVFDGGGNGNDARAATTVTNAIVPPGRPTAPSVSSVAGSTTSLLVTWTAPTNTGPAIDNYDLQYRQGTSGNFTDGPQDQPGTSATIPGLTASTSYQVQVRATSSGGDSPWSPSGSGQTNSAGNSAPTFPSSTATRSVAENSGGGTDVGNPVTADDVDSGDTLTYTLEGGDAVSFTIVSTSGQIRTRSGVTYDYETTPSYTVIVKADDNNGGTDTVTVTIDLDDDTNEPPRAPAAPRVTATPNTTDSLTVSWSAPSNTGRPDIDSYDLQYREGTTGLWTNGPQTVSGTSDTITGLTADPDTYQVQVRATNADGAGPWSPPGRISRGGTEPPQAVDDVAETSEDTPVTIDVLANDSDPDGDTLTVVEVLAPAHGTAVVADTGAVEYRPESDYHGTDRFTYVVGDESGLTAQAAVEVTVLPVNDPPQAVDDAAETPENTPVSIAVLANDSDPDGDPLTVVEVSSPAHGTAVVADTGAVVYTPERDYRGPDRFTYVVGDGSGLTAQAAVEVTVQPANEPPQAVDDAAETPEDTPAFIDVLANDSDPDGDTLTVVEVSAPAHGTAVVADTGAVEYTPERDYHGSDRFTYVVGDGSGLTAQAAVEVTVLPVNDPPQALDDAAETPEDTPVTIAVRANDSDGDGDPLALVEASAPAHGSARLTDTGAVEYTPERDYHGTDRFTYMVGDGSGLTAQAAVEVTVLPVNDPPLALDDAAETPEDTPVTIAVLANDSDGDGDTLTLVEASAPAHGSARLTDTGAVEYTPERDYHGTDRFTYMVGDGSGLTAQAAVEVTVLPVNDPPLAIGVIPDQTLEAGDGPASFDLSPFFEDRDGDALGYSAVASEPAVALSLAGATLTLTVARPGAATVTVTAQDPGGLTATQAFLVTTTDRQARGVVEDTLAALGRGHLASARATLGRRVETTGREQSQVTVAGLHVPLGTAGVVAAGQAVAQRWLTGLAAGMPLGVGGRSGPGAGAVPGAFGVAGAPGALGSPAGALGLAAGGAPFGSAGAAQFGAGASPTLSSVSPLGGGGQTDFLLALGNGQAGNGQAGGVAWPGRWTVWGQIDRQAFGGERSPASRYDGHLQTAYVGVDARLSDRWLAGVAVARSRGDGDWTFGSSTGRLTTSLTSVQPYLRWSAGGTTIWATAGGGSGTAENERVRYGLQEESDLGLRLGLVEVRRRLATVGPGVELQLRGDASWARLATAGGDELIDALEVGVRQVRVGIDMSRPVRTAGGTLVEPFGEVHARHDGGSGQTGAGLEVAGGLRVARGVFRVEGMGRLLALHAADGYREHGGAVTLSVGDGARQPGLTLSLSPRWGAPATASDALWQDELFHRRADGTPGARRDVRALDARVDYGLPLSAGGLVTPFGIYGQSQYGRRLQVGLLLSRLGPLGLEVSGERSALRHPGRDEYRMSVLGSITFGGADNASTSLSAVQ